MLELACLLFIVFVAGLGFVPAKDLAEKVKGAAQLATIVAALAAVIWLAYVRTR